MKYKKIEALAHYMAESATVSSLFVAGGTLDPEQVKQDLVQVLKNASGEWPQVLQQLKTATQGRLFIGFVMQDEIIKTLRYNGKSITA